MIGLQNFHQMQLRFLKDIYVGNIRELKNVLERAYILFSNKKIEKNHVLENLIRLKAPTSKEEQEALWDATQELDTPNNIVI